MSSKPTLRPNEAKALRVIKRLGLAPVLWFNSDILKTLKRKGLITTMPVAVATTKRVSRNKKGGAQ